MNDSVVSYGFPKQMQQNAPDSGRTPRIFRLAVTYGPDVEFKGHLVTQGWAQEGDYRQCAISIFKTKDRKYVMYTTWRMLQENDNGLNMYEMVPDIQGFMRMLKNKDHDMLFIQALKTALRRGGFDPVINL